ncbi:hypothetical protein V2J09_021414 [Rumex salicifolius]
MGTSGRFTRAAFTRARGEDTGRYIAKHIDRVFMCSTARTQWAEASVFHLAKVGSDRAPLLITLESQKKTEEGAVRSNSRLRGLPSLKLRISSALSESTKQLLIKRKLMARLEGIQKSFSRGVSSNLFRLEAQLKKELNTILLHEETLWMQKSHEQWLASRDRDTSFFHLSIVIKRKRSRIKELKDAANEPVTNDTCMEAMALSFFRSLYTLPEAENVPNTVGRGVFHIIDGQT